jgi:hypothetical protein
MLKLDLRQLVGRADAVFVGKVLKVQSKWTEDGKRIVTDATVEVKQSVRGTTLGQKVVVRSLGGSVGETGMKVSGSPVFRAGDEVLLFTDTRQGHRYVVGMSQGAYYVSRDKAGRAMVQASVAGLGFLQKTASGTRVAHEANVAPEPLDRLVQKVRDTITACSKDKSLCPRD